MCNFVTAHFKIWTLNKILNFKTIINYGELGKYQEIFFTLTDFWNSRSKFLLDHNEGFSEKQYSFILDDLWVSKYELSVTILNAFQWNVNFNFRVSDLEILLNHAKPQNVLNRYLKSINKQRLMRIYACFFMRKCSWSTNFQNIATIPRRAILVLAQPYQRLQILLNFLAHN